MSHAPGRDEHEPRTIRSQKPLSPTMQTSTQPPLPAPRRCPRTPTNDTYTNRPQDSSAPSTSNIPSDTMALPPHLRPRKAHSTSHTSPDPPACDTTPPTEVTMGRKKPTAVPTTANNETGLLTPPPTASYGIDIREKLRDHGVLVSDPMPAPSAKSSLVPDVGSNEIEERVAKRAPSHLASQATKTGSKKDHAQSSAGDRAKGRDFDKPPSARGRGNGSRGRGNNARTPSVLLPPKTAEPPSKVRLRSSRWPKNSEMRPYPREHDTMWDEPGTHRAYGSVSADAGWGDKKGSKRKDIDSETGFKLTGWDGDWAPVSATYGSVMRVLCD